MKLVMTLLAGDDADIVDAQVAFHLNAGVDFVVATAAGSQDGTTEILETYQREGCLHLVSQPAGAGLESECLTRMARLAATELGADWVINSRADEFWWPRGGTLKDVLAVVPHRFSVVRGMRRHFVPRPADDRFFAERMTVRLCAPVIGRDHPFNPHFKALHRGDPEVTIGTGGYEAFGESLVSLRDWYPVDVLHFPLRTIAQSEREHVAVVDDDALARGLQDGTLTVDARLRDGLRALRAGGAPDFAERDVDPAYVAEIAALEPHDAVQQAERRIAELERRLSALETSLPSRLRSRLSRVCFR